MKIAHISGIHWRGTNKETLTKLYCTQELSLRQVAELFGVTYATVRAKLIKFGIPRRTRTEAAQGNKNAFFGRKHTRQSLEKMSRATCGKNNGFFGKTHSDHTKNKISKANKGRLAGRKSPNWKPVDQHKKTLNKALRDRIESKNWRQAVFEKDDYTCQFCKTKGGNLNADHIVPLALLIQRNAIETLEEAVKCVELWDIGNGRTLCISCHKKTKTWGARTKALLKKDSI